MLKKMFSTVQHCSTHPCIGHDVIIAYDLMDLAHHVVHACSGWRAVYSHLAVLVLDLLDCLVFPDELKVKHRFESVPAGEASEAGD